MFLKSEKLATKRLHSHRATLNHEELGVGGRGSAWSLIPSAGTLPPSHMAWSLGFRGLVPYRHWGLWFLLFPATRVICLKHRSLPKRITWLQSNFAGGKKSCYARPITHWPHPPFKPMSSFYPPFTLNGVGIFSFLRLCLSSSLQFECQVLWCRGRRLCWNQTA